MSRTDSGYRSSDPVYRDPNAGNDSSSGALWFQMGERAQENRFSSPYDNNTPVPHRPTPPKERQPEKQRNGTPNGTPHIHQADLPNGDYNVIPGYFQRRSNARPLPNIPTNPPNKAVSNRKRIVCVSVIAGLAVIAAGITVLYLYDACKLGSCDASDSTPSRPPPEVARQTCEKFNSTMELNSSQDIGCSILINEPTRLLLSHSHEERTLFEIERDILVEETRIQINVSSSISVTCEWKDGNVSVKVEITNIGCGSFGTLHVTLFNSTSNQNITIPINVNNATVFCPCEVATLIGYPGNITCKLDQDTNTEVVTITRRQGNAEVAIASNISIKQIMQAGTDGIPVNAGLSLEVTQGSYNQQNFLIKFAKAGDQDEGLYRIKLGDKTFDTDFTVDDNLCKRQYEFEAGSSGSIDCSTNANDVTRITVNRAINDTHLEEMANVSVDTLKDNGDVFIMKTEGEMRLESRKLKEGGLEVRINFMKTACTHAHTYIVAFGDIKHHIVLDVIGQRSTPVISDTHNRARTDLVEGFEGDLMCEAWTGCQDVQLELCRESSTVTSCVVEPIKPFDLSDPVKDEGYKKRYNYVYEKELVLNLNNTQLFCRYKDKKRSIWIQSAPYNAKVIPKDWCDEQTKKDKAILDDNYCTASNSPPVIPFIAHPYYRYKFITCTERPAIQTCAVPRGRKIVWCRTEKEPCHGRCVEEGYEARRYCIS